MKFLRKFLLGAIVLSSLMPLQMSASMPPSNLKMWWRSTYFTDYLPQWVQSYIPRARVRQMFYGVVKVYDDIRDLEASSSCTKTKMNKLVKNYLQWMQQYKDIINEGTILSGASIHTGKPDSILGLWKTIFMICYEIDIQNTCILPGVKEIIDNLKAMGAQIHAWEKMLIEPYELLIAELSI